MIQNVAQGYNTDNWMPFSVMLKCISTCVGANALLQHHNFKNPAHQWLVLICESSSGKSAVTRHMTQPIYNMQAYFDNAHRSAMDEFDEAMERYEKERRKLPVTGQQQHCVNLYNQWQHLCIQTISPMKV